MEKCPKCGSDRLSEEEIKEYIEGTDQDENGEWIGC
jgi:predicted nucleic-acid-binding Zn-ribbon protein